MSDQKKPLFKIVPGSRVKASSNGYYYVETDPPHPPPHGMKLKDRNKVYVYEHIAQLELKLGRFLKGDEQPDHLDKDRSNNDPKNLSLTSQGIHQKEHSKTNHFWKKSPRTKPRKASVYNVVAQFLSETI